MAKRNSRNNNKLTKFKKIEPSVKSLFFNFTATGGVVTNTTLDLSQCVSLVNRRFYRQGLNWAVSGIKFVTLTANPATNIAVLKLPETWTMSNSWHKGMASWSDMNDDALEESPSVRPRFLDFKIFADDVHHAAGFAANMTPLAADLNTPAVLGEWESSKLRIPVGPANPGDTTDREIIATGANYPGVGASGLNAVSLIEGYASSRGLPEIRDPNAPDDATSAVGTTPENWMAALKNEGTEQISAVLDDLITENNQAPYPFENAQVPGAAPGVTFADTMYPSGANQLVGLAVHDVNTDTQTTVGGITRLSGGLFPCGLMRFSVANIQPEATNVTYLVQIDLVPGHHRGYLAEPMQDM